MEQDIYMIKSLKSRAQPVLRKLWWFSPERRAVLKRDNNTCVECHRKASKAEGREVKVEVHHKKGEIRWDKIVKVLEEELFVPIEDMETLCKECHAMHTYRDKEKIKF